MTVDGDGSVEKLTPSPEFDGGAVVDRLVSDLASLDERVVLVIDDLHELRSADALAQLQLLLTRLAEPDGIVLPFALTGTRDLLERHPWHQTAHAALLADILRPRPGDQSDRRAPGRNGLGDG